MTDDVNQQFNNYQDDSNQVVGMPQDDLQEPEVVPISISPGSPESAPIPMPQEQRSESVEYGYEQIKQVETANESLSQIERKEATPVKTQDENQIEAKPLASKVPEPAPQAQGPKIFGYYIPPAITSNLTNIRQKKGTGNPQDATTWIYVLLDRLLKKQTYKD